MTVIDSRIRNMVALFFAQCEPVVADARTRWATAGELDQFTALQLRAWAVERALDGHRSVSDQSQAREVQDWRILNQWLTGHHLDRDD
ncbi:MAG TPA: hypothetical protein VGE95_16880 [Arthrobacter sp.]